MSGFTARMEDELDEVANGERTWPPVVQEFYDPLEAGARTPPQTSPRVEQQTDEKCEKCGKPMIVRWGRFGQFLACTGFPECKNTRPLGEEAAQRAAADRREVRRVRVAHGDQARPLRPVPRVLAVSGVQGRAPDPEEGRRALPEGRRRDRREDAAKRGRTSTRARTIPNCDFTSWYAPAEAACPTCGGLIVMADEGRRRNARSATGRATSTSRRRARTGESVGVTAAA